MYAEGDGALNKTLEVVKEASRAVGMQMGMPKINVAESALMLKREDVV